MLKRNNRVIMIGLLVSLSFIALYGGHFLLRKTEHKDQANKNTVNKNTENKKTTRPFQVNYKHVSTIINGNPQEINILEINTRDHHVEIKPVLSYNSVFGFEKLSSMAARSNAYAAINAGFFFPYGNPSGGVIIDGKIMTMSTGNAPVFIVKNGKAELKQIKTNSWLVHGQDKIKVDKMNALNPQSGTVLYTQEFGSDNRANKENISITIRNNRIISIGKYPGKVEIPQDSTVLSLYKPYKYEIDKLFKMGDDLKLFDEPDLSTDIDAYECGSWIVKDGKIVIENEDPWVGVMTNHDPRTIIGIKDDEQVVILTVDGRQPGYSAGFTGKELGEFILNYGITNAAMLDGGASTEMIVKGKIVNRPSAGGLERPLGGGIIVKIK